MTDRTFTQGEAYALVDDAVKRETAAAATRISELEGQVTTLQNANDVLETEKAAEIKRADEAAQALTEFKEQLEAEKAREARRTERTQQVAEAAPLLEITQDRSDRIVAMSDEVFEAYLADLREVASKGPKVPDADADDQVTTTNNAKKAKKDMPRQSAAFAGADTTTTDGLGTVKGLIGASRALRSA